MDFEFSEDHLSVQKLCREFALKNVAPNLRENDRAHKFDSGLLSKMARADLLGLCLPEKYGGAGMDYISPGKNRCRFFIYFQIRTIRYR